MAYSSKHSSGGSHARPESPRPSSGAPRGGKNGGSNQKAVVIVVLAVLVCIIVVALMFILGVFNCSKDSGSVNGGGNSAGQYSTYVPETQGETTIISKYYDSGILPTAGASHGVDVISGGGRSAGELQGAWTTDNVTTYVFDGFGRGVLLTAVDNYTFIYSAQDGKLAIDHDNDGGIDKEYSYTINGDTLTMVTSDNVTYTLTRTVVE